MLSFHLSLAAVAALTSVPQDAPISDELLFDTPRAGELWVRGSTYKAGFGTDGAVFVPFLGSHAPRNFPLAFALEEVLIGEQALTLNADSSWQRAGSQVSRDRGALVELYTFTEDSVEQAFRFDVLPAAGELVLRVRVDTELQPFHSTAGLSFEGVHGGVHLGKATAFDAGGRSTTAPMQLADGSLEIRVAAGFLAHAELPLLIDPLLTTFAVDDSSADDEFPEVAYDGSLDVHVVCWQREFSASDHDVHGHILDAAGNTLREFALDLSQDDNLRPKVAGIDALDQFLVVSLHDHSAISRTIELAGSMLEIGPPVEQLESCYSHDLGGDAGLTPPFRYCLVAQVLVTWAYIDVRWIESDGQPGAWEYFHDSESWVDQPRIANTARGPVGGMRSWPMTWENYSGGPPMISTRLLHLDGTLGGGFPNLGPRGSVQGISSMLEGASGELLYLVVWKETLAGPIELRARLVRGASELASPVLQLNAVAGPDPGTAVVDSDGSCFVVAWTELEDTDATLNLAAYAFADADLKLTERVRVTPPGIVARAPSLFAARSNGGASQRFLAAWSESTPSGEDVHAALYDTPGPGTRFCTGAPNSVGSGATLSAAGSISIALDELELRVDGCPPNQTGMFFLGLAEIELPFGEGFRCVGDPTRRIVPAVTTDNTGHAHMQLDFDLSYGDLVTPGSPGQNYQFWYRDPAGGPAAFNLSDALRVEHTP